MRHAVLILCMFVLPLWGSGQLISKTEMDVRQTDYFKNIAGDLLLNEQYRYIDSLDFYRVSYLSNGLHINGFVVAPSQANTLLPVVIFNRGGNRNFATIGIETLLEWIAPIARAGYIVVASQYRGGGGSEGNDEFGGNDVNDVLNLFPVITEWPGADTQRIGMYGWSRGGMMTYIALTKTKKIKAAVIGGAPADLAAELTLRPKMEDLYASLIPGYTNNKVAELRKRSAISWPDKLCPSTPILILHGTKDVRADYKQAQAMFDTLSALRHPVQLKLFEDGDHIIGNNRRLKDEMVISWLRQYL